MADAGGALAVPAAADGTPPRMPAFLALGLSALEAERSRWFTWVPVMLGCGIALYFALPVEPPLWSGGLAVVAAVVLRRVGGRETFGDVATAMLTLAAIGFGLMTLRTVLAAAPVLVAELKAAEVRGFVTLVEPRAEGGLRVTLRVTSISGLGPEATPHRVRISTPGPSSGLAPGDGVVVVARLSPPATAALPGGYDFARHAYFQRLGGVGYAVQPPRRDDDAGPPPASLRFDAGIETVRQAIGARISAALPGETGAIAAALITGERGAISDATNDAYRDSGLFHILSISGLHMAIMGGSVFWLVRLLLALVPGVALIRPTKKWAAVVALLASLGYLAISGGSFATIRSFSMIAVMFFAVLLDRPAIAMRNVAVSALVILVIYPESLLDAGFQMSFAAVVALVAAYEALRDRLADRERRAGLGFWLKGALFFGGIVFSTLVASAAVAPFAAYHFHKSQQFAVIANLIAVPLTNLVVMPAALATLVALPLGLEAAPLWIMGVGIDAMSEVARRVAALPGAVAHLPSMPDIAFGLMLGGGLWLLLWHARWRLLGLVAIAAGLGLAPLRNAPDLLIGRNGDLVAVRGADGNLAFLTAAGGRFEIERWLEHDGDGREAADIVDARLAHLAASASGARQAAARSVPTPAMRPSLNAGGPTTSTVARVAALHCDGIGCTTIIGGTRIAIPRHPAAVATDCRNTDVVVLFVSMPPGCAPRTAAIDRAAVSALGTHAVYVEAPGSIRIETVAGRLGRRPWSRHQALLTEGAARETPQPTRSRLPEFASPGLAEVLANRRPDTEDAAATLDASQ